MILNTDNTILTLLHISVIGSVMSWVYTICVFFSPLLFSSAAKVWFDLPALTCWKRNRLQEILALIFVVTVIKQRAQNYIIIQV